MRKSCGSCFPRKEGSTLPEERIQKLIAEAGLCSRRTAEQWIAEGRVRVNGETAMLGQRADAKSDQITVDGAPVARVEQKRYLMLNKPRGYVCTLSDERGRPTVTELVGDCGVRVYPVGRLDLDSEGLLLLTNDGAWMQRLLHPHYEVDKVYHVTVAGDTKDAAERLMAITALDGEPIRRAQVRVLRQGRDTALLAITIHEGKNRQIRRMCAACGLYVKRLRRVAEHALTLGGLPEGAWRDLTPQELAATKNKG